ncbi:MAG TPA: OmpW family outer membrane protein [Sphingomicrobium sp.]|nr:OmpW family outer membrane protein [Sphingomicrobium sp.]
MLDTALSLLAASAVQASPPPGPAQTMMPDAVKHGEERPMSRWSVRAGVARALYNSDARITTGGNVIPQSTARVTDNTTLTLDVGYDVSDDISLMFMTGIPPSADVIGEGSVSSFGKLGHVRFGPVVLTAVYRLPAWNGVRPYVGAGGAHLFILKTDDRAVKDLEVQDHNGFVLQGGVEYRLSRKWEVFADYKHIWLNVHATGSLAGQPVRAKVTLDPDLISVGLKFHFD